MMSCPVQRSEFKFAISIVYSGTSLDHTLQFQNVAIANRFMNISETNFLCIINQNEKIIQLAGAPNIDLLVFTEITWHRKITEFRKIERIYIETILRRWRHVPKTFSCHEEPAAHKNSEETQLPV